MAVPQCDRETEVLVPVADAGKAILIPAICPAASVVVGKVGPRIAIRAIVLTHGTPGPLAEVGTPMLPVGAALAVCQQALVFCCSFHHVLVTVTRQCPRCAERTISAESGDKSPIWVLVYAVRCRCQNSPRPARSAARPSPGLPSGALEPSPSVSCFTLHRLLDHTQSGSWWFEGWLDIVAHRGELCYIPTVSGVQPAGKSTVAVLAGRDAAPKGSR